MSTIFFPWFFIAVSFTIGLFAASMDHAFVYVVAFLYFLFLLYTRKRLLLVSGCIFLFGYFYYEYVDKGNQTLLSSSTNEIKGSVVSIPKIDGDSSSFFFRLENGEKVMVSYKLQSSQEKQQVEKLMIHSTCQLKGEMIEPEGKTNPYAFDYRKYLREKKVHWIFRSTAIRCTPLVDPTISQKIRVYRQANIQKLEHTVHGETKSVLQALVFGYQDGFVPALHDAYRQLGIIHLLVISGSHVSIFTALFFFFMIRIGMTRERSLELLLILLPVYAVVTGESPSVVRACLMAFFLCFSLRFRFFMKPIDAISLAAFVMLLFQPYLLFHAGFQLTFMISLCLVLSSTYVLSLSSYIKQMFITSLISELASLPILLFHFYEVSMISLLVNLLYIPIMTMLIFPLAYIIYFFPSLFGVPFILESLLRICHRFFLWLTTDSTFMITVGKPSLVWVGLMYSAIFFFFVVMEKGESFRTWLRPLFLCLMIFLFPLLHPYFSSKGEVTMIDVGQGESMLIELPKRKGVYLIDTGGVMNYEKETWKQKKDPFDTGEDIVVPLLKAKGITKIDRLILTHGDTDHIGGTIGILREISVNEVWYPSTAITSDLEKNVMQRLKQQEVPVRFVKAGNEQKDMFSYWHVLNPGVGSEASDNNQSIVLYAEIGGLTWLFTGDLEKEGEQKIMEKYPDLRIDVLKAGHHGSKTSTSSEWIAHLQPKWIYISVGRNNRFNHPHPEVIETLEAVNKPIFRTDKQGAIIYTFYGKEKGTFSVTKQKRD